MNKKKRLKVYDKVNSCTTLKKLAKIIRELADENGQIQGRTRRFNANQMADYCLKFRDHIPNVLTREFGIRQQAMHIIHFGEQ